MTAIYGVLGGDAADLARMGARLAHRGARAVAWSPATDLHFGQRVAELGPGPAGAHLLLDGIVDNRRELAALLGRPAERAKTADAVLLHELYLTFGPAILDRVNGQFALALWDPGRRRLVLARDAWGVRTLYFARTSGRILFASECKALLALDDVPAELDRDTVQYIQCTRSMPREGTGFARISAVPAGTWLELDRSSTRSPRDYRRLTVRAGEDRSTAEHAEVLHRELGDAVQRQVRGRGRLGIALSAGVDSAMVLAAMRRAHGGTIHSFSAGYGADDPDLAAAAAIARHFGTVHHELILAPEELFNLLPQMLWQIEQPIGREEMIFYQIVAREASRHVDLLLTGHQADALFAGMPRHLLVKLAAGWRWLRGPLAEFIDYTQVGARPRSVAGQCLVNGYFRRNQFQPPRIEGASGSPQAPHSARPGNEPLNAYLHRTLLHGGNALGMVGLVHAAYGLDMTSPFFDRRLADMAFAVPDGLKIQGTRQKYILREVAARMLPAHLLPRRKGLLRLRHDAAFADALDRLADDLLAPAVLRERGLVDPAYVARLRRRRAGRPYPTEQLYRLWSLLLLELWLRLFVDRRGAHLEAGEAPASRVPTLPRPMAA